MGSFAPDIDFGKLAKAGIEKSQFGHRFVYRYPESKDMPALDTLELAKGIAGKKHKSIAFYFHIPFCSRLCGFCHYYKERGCSQKNIEKFTLYMEKEVAAYRNLAGGNPKIESVLFGGGTPTLLGEKELAELLSFFSGLFPLKHGAEVSIESSPETLSQKKLSALRGAGFNRLSIGVQDFSPAIIRAGGRAHSTGQAEKAVEIARGAGFDNINLDLIYGMPGQSTGQWEKTLEKTLALGAESITASDLRVQEGTAFFSLGRALFPSVREMAEMYYCFVEKCAAAGYVQQFPYQFVRKGKEMRFLENQWSSGEFLGIGPSGCSFISDWDYNNAFPLGDFFGAVERNGISAALGKKLSDEELMRRFAALGLKRSGANTKNGIDKGEFKRRFGRSMDSIFAAQIGELEKLGLIEENSSAIKLSRIGLFFHDEAARKFF